MKLSLPQGIMARARSSPRPGFRVVMAYDDFASGKRAMEACTFLVRQLGSAIEPRTSMWKFDVLRNPKLHQMAVDDAIEADVIIVANAQNAGLPEEARIWVDGWASRKRGQTAALVALLDFTGNDISESTLAYAFLKGAAASAKIDFLAQEIRFPANPLFAIPPDVLKKDAPVKADQIRNRRGFEGWGLND